MTLPLTGVISVSQINLELGAASNAVCSLGGATSRTLSGLATGMVNMNSFHGKTSSAFAPIRVQYFLSSQALTDARLATFTTQTATALPCTITINAASTYYTYIAVPVELGFVRFWDVGASVYRPKMNTYVQSFHVCRWGTNYYNVYKLATASLGARTIEIHADTTAWNPTWPDASWTYVGQIDAHATSENNDFHLDTTLTIPIQFNQLAFDDVNNSCAVNMEGGASTGWTYGPGVVERIIDPTATEWALDMGLNATAARGDCPRFYILRKTPAFPTPAMAGGYKAFDKGRTFMLDFDTPFDAGDFFFQDSQPLDAVNNYGDATINVYARLNT